MDSVLEGLIGKICFVYVDDIIIFSKDIDEHIRHVQTVVERLKMYKLKIKMNE